VMVMMQKTIAVLPKNSTEDLKIELGEFHGYNLCALSVYVKPIIPGEDGAINRKGVTVITFTGV
jgi:hypothetical protein